MSLRKVTKLSAESKRRPKFDEQKFFDYLGKRADHAEKSGARTDQTLLNLLRSIDIRASLEISALVCRYLRPFEEEPLRTERRERGDKIKRHLRATIDRLLEATRAYRELAATEIPGHGSVLSRNAPQLPDGTLLLPHLLESEAVRLSILLNAAEKTYNEKRFGVSGNHFWLIILQDFVAVWTERELGHARALQPGEIASLLTAGRIALGWSKDLCESGKNADLVRKAILNFRSNKANMTLCALARDYARRRCERIPQRPFPRGIQI